MSKVPSPRYSVDAVGSAASALTPRLAGLAKGSQSPPGLHTRPAPPAPATPQYHPQPATRTAQAQALAGSHWPVPLKCRLKLQPVVRRLQWQWQLPSQSQSKSPPPSKLHPIHQAHYKLQYAVTTNGTRLSRDKKGGRLRNTDWLGSRCYYCSVSVDGPVISHLDKCRNEALRLSTFYPMPG